MLSALRSAHGKEPIWMLELSNHLEPVLENARIVDCKRKQLQESYKTWLTGTDKIIETTTSIRDKIIAANRKNNYISVGSTVSGIAGSIMGIVAVATALPTGGASLLAVGSIVAGGSTALSIGSNLNRNNVIEKLCKKAVANLEKNNKGTEFFRSQCESYFEALEKFISIFQTIKGNDAALSLFYEAAGDERFDFIYDLNLDKWSRNKIRFALQEVIKSGEMEIKPHMWSLEFVNSAKGTMRSLSEKIHNMLAQIREFIMRDPYIYRFLREKMREYLVTRLGDMKISKIEKAVTNWVKNIAVSSIVPMGFTAGSCINIRNLAKEMSTAARFALVALNGIYALLGFVFVTKTLINIEQGSQSDESKSIAEAVVSLKKVRKKVVKEMGQSFGW